MRLLAVCQVDRPGGPENGLLRLLRRLRDRGWEITLTSPGVDGPGPLAHAGFAWEPLEVGGLAHGAGARAVASWPRARRLAREHDVTYLNGTVAGRLLPALRGRSTVLHVHDIVERVPRHWRVADLVLADSRACGARLDPLDVHVVGCPVELDPPIVSPPWPAQAGSGAGPVVAFVGRLEPRKGPHELIAAAPALRAVRPDVQIVIVGDDPYDDSDPGYAEEVRASTEVDHVGRVAEAAGVLHHLDVLVLPSRQEPFGTVVAEAMAAGTPVVASNVDGLPELVTDGVDGALVEPGDPAALAAAILRVLAQRDAMGAAARDAAQRFGADAYADRVEHLLRQILPGERAATRRRGLHDHSAT